MVGPEGTGNRVLLGRTYAAIERYHPPLASICGCSLAVSSPDVLDDCASGCIRILNMGWFYHPPSNIYGIVRWVITTTNDPGAQIKRLSRANPSSLPKGPRRGRPPGGGLAGVHICSGKGNVVTRVLTAAIGLKCLWFSHKGPFVERAGNAETS
jgi:hypothetical protein